VPADAPLIVAGDFNDWRRRANDILWTEAGLREIFVNAYGEPAKTFPAIFPVLALDRIYINGGRRGYLLGMDPEVLVRLLQPVLVDVALEE